MSKETGDKQLQQTSGAYGYSYGGTYAGYSAVGYGDSGSRAVPVRSSGPFRITS